MWQRRQEDDAKRTALLEVLAVEHARTEDSIGRLEETQLHLPIALSAPVLDRAHRLIEDSTHFLPFITDEFGNELPALRRVRFPGCQGAAYSFRFGDVGDGGAEGECLGDTSKTAFAAEFRGGLRCRFGL
jgi:hypothetical protein